MGRPSFLRIPSPLCPAVGRVVLAYEALSHHASVCENTMSFPVTSDASVTCSDLTFRWADDTTVFDGLSMAVGRGR